MLSLARGLLDFLVGNLETGEITAHDQPHAIPAGHIALVVNAEITSRSIVGVVLWNHGIEVATGHAARRAAAKSIGSPSVLGLGKSACGSKAAAGKHDLPVQSRLCIFQRIHLNDAAHFASKLRWNAGSVDRERIHIVGLNLWTKSRGAVVGQRNSVDYELCLIFST